IRTMATAFNHHARLINQGRRVSRVIATENQKAVYKDSLWQVDGQTIQASGPSNVQPPQLENSTVPAGYMLIDATDEFAGEWASTNAQLGTILVPLNQLRGVVYLRSWPIWRVSLF